MPALPAWLDTKPADFVRAAAEGASAGQASAALAQRADQHSAELAQQAQAMQQKTQMEAAKLSQEQQMAAMEAEQRRNIAEQNALRQNQQALIAKSMKDAQIGLAQMRLQQQSAIAQAKGQAAAETFAREQAWVKELKDNGGDVLAASQKYPVAPSIVNAFTKVARDKSISSEKPEKVTVSGQDFVKFHNQLHPVRGNEDKVFHNKDGSLTIYHGQDGTTETVNKPQTDSVSLFDSLNTPAAESKPGILGRIKGMFSDMIPAPEPSSPTPVVSKSPFIEGQKVRNKKDGKLYVIKNGQPIPMGETSAEEPAPDRGDK